MSLKLKIDGKEVEVENGQTILDAARKLGVEIPTLCYLEGIRAASSCFLCVVEVKDRPRLVPACVAPAEDGMIVATDSDDIRAARRMALELLLSDHVGDCVAPCTLACPARLDIPGFIRHIAAGDFPQALDVVRERIPLAGVLGRVCRRYCERVCRRADRDEAIAICGLKRFAADANVAAEGQELPARAGPTGRSVAIVGAGPAGLSAAYYLQRLGHACTLFDAHRQPGGMLRYGIPAFRLPRGVLDAEVDVIRKIGAEFRMNVSLGADVALGDLCRGYDAVFLAMGAQAAGSRGWAGASLALSALEFLRRVAEGDHPTLGDNVFVVGDGNEGVDAARTAVRLGAKQVTLLSEKPRNEMACSDEYVDAAEAEGVPLQVLARPVRLEARADGQLTLHWEREGAPCSTQASCVIAAPERGVETSLVQALGVDVSRQGIAVDRKTLATNLPGVFAGGDVVSGPSTAVRAVAAGHLAALSIHQHLTGQAVTGEPSAVNVHMGTLSEPELAALFRDVEKCSRVRQAALGMPQRRTSFAEVVQGLTEEDAVEEARRCLQCDCLAREDCKLRRYATEYGADPRRFRGERRRFDRDATHPQVVYESGKCILCGLCVRIAEQSGERPGVGFMRRGFAARVAVPFGASLADGLSSAAVRCATACPTGALALKRQKQAKEEDVTGLAANGA